jgi:hypothetical protein
VNDLGRGRRDDLFAIFPDLPSARLRPIDEQVARMRRLLVDTRERALRNVARQREAAEQVRARLESRQRDRSYRRR